MIREFKKKHKAHRSHKLLIDAGFKLDMVQNLSAPATGPMLFYKRGALVVAIGHNHKITPRKLVDWIIQQTIHLSRKLAFISYGKIETDN